MRFTDLTLIRRLTVIPHGPHPPPFVLWAEDDIDDDDGSSSTGGGGGGVRGGIADGYEPDAHRIFKALDVVWCYGKEEDDDGKIRKMKPSAGGKDGGALWSIREERNWAFLKLVSALSLVLFVEKKLI